MIVEYHLPQRNNKLEIGEEKISSSIKGNSKAKK